MIAINNMRMPSSCELCYFKKTDPFDGRDYCNQLDAEHSTIIYEQDRLEDCPLIEVEDNYISKHEIDLLFKDIQSDVENRLRCYHLPVGTSARKVGKWIKYNTADKYDYMGDRVTVSNYQCSECGRMIYDIGDAPLTNKLKDYLFCHCGAEMVGAEG